MPPIAPDGTFQLFDAQSGKELNRIIGQATANSEHCGDEEHIIAFPEWCLSPSGKWLARVDPIATKSTTKAQWQEVATGKIVATIEVARCSFHRPQFSPDGKYFAVIASKERDPRDDTESWQRRAGSDPHVGRCYPAGGSDLCTASTIEGDLSAAPFCLFTRRRLPGGQRIWRSVRTASSECGRWQARNHRGPWTASRMTQRIPTPFAFSPDSKTIAALHAGKLGLWDAATGKQVKLVADYDAACGMLGFSPDGGRLLAC